MGATGVKGSQRKGTTERTDGRENKPGRCRGSGRTFQNRRWQSISERCRRHPDICCRVGTATRQASNVLIANPRNNNKTEVGKESVCVKEGYEVEALIVRFKE